MKFNKFMMTSALLAFAFTSCEKEEVFEDSDAAEIVAESTLEIPSEIGVFTLNGEGRVPSVTMLEFPTFDIFQDKIDELEKEAEAHDDAFLFSTGNMSEEALEDYEDSVNYDPHQPYVDYEAGFRGFKSLRQDIMAKEEVWLNNEVLDDSKDPDNHYVFDDGERTLLNVNGQVKIGRYVYQRTKYGFIKVLDNDLETLYTVHNEDVRTLELPNIEIQGAYFGSIDADSDASERTTCWTWRERQWIHQYASKRRIKGKQKLTGPGPFRSSIKAKTIHYKKKRRRWKRRRAPITAKIQGQTLNKHCSQPVNKNQQYSRNRRSVKVKDRLPAGAVGSYGHYRTAYRKLKTVHFKNGTSQTQRYFWQ